MVVGRKMKRKQPNLSEKLAAALLELKVADANGNLVPVVDYEEAKDMTPQQIIAHFECDHWPIPVHAGGGNHPTNLKWREKGEHRQKTSKRDVPEFWKGIRLTKKQNEFRQRMLAKAEASVSDCAAGEGGTARPKRRWPSRPMGKAKQRT